MKNLEKSIAASSHLVLAAARRCSHRHFIRLHRCAGKEDFLQAGHDDLVIRLEAGLYDAQAVDYAAERDVLAHRLVLRAEHVDVLAILVGHDRLVVDQDRGEFATALKLHARIQAGCEHTVGIGHHRARADRAGRRIDLVADEVHRAGVRIARLAGEADAHRIRRAGTFALAREFRIAQIGLLVRLEIDVDRILRNHSCQHALVGLGQIADSQQRAADASCDRRAHLGEIEIEAGVGNGGLSRAHVGITLGQIGCALIVFLARDRLLPD